MDRNIKTFFEKASSFMFSDNGLKVLSVLLAIMCWYGIRSIIDSDQTFPTPFSFGGESEGREIELVLPIRAVFADGDAEFSFQIDPEVAVVNIFSNLPRHELAAVGTLTLYVDCSLISSSGSYRLPISFLGPRGAKAIDISPSDAKIEIRYSNEK